MIWTIGVVRIGVALLLTSIVQATFAHVPSTAGEGPSVDSNQVPVVASAGQVMPAGFAAEDRAAALKNVDQSEPPLTLNALLVSDIKKV